MHYGDDLTFVHDEGFSQHARGAAPALVAMLRAHGLGNGVVVDLGCGGGVLAAVLDREGFEVVGVDLSASMIEMASRRVPNARFMQGSFLEVDLPACEAVFALGEVFNYLMDEGVGAEGALAAAFARVHAALRPGGLFVFDIAGPGRRPGGSAQRHWVEDDWAMCLDVSEDGEELVRRITTFRRLPDGSCRRSDEVHRLRLYEPDVAAGMLEDAGFREVTRLDRYGEAAFPPGLYGFVGRRP